MRKQMQGSDQRISQHLTVVQEALTQLCPQ
uniref:Uncharacterized protein n=1 Tax=Rhizophora mucronata TaxID=61149 RepID=A0A2P2PD26_RHIMU